MMIGKRVIFSVFIIFLLASGAVLAQTEQGQKILNEGITDFQNSRFNQAISTFREILVDPSMTEYQDSAYFWIAKSNMALGYLDEAEEDMEYFITSFPNSRYISEARYQQARIEFLKGNYQEAIQIFSSFIEQYPNSPYVANAYYWMGDSLLSLGHTENAKEMYEIVITEYPTSYRVEAANYKISVINLKKREDELVKLLKWSHEEALKAFEEFQQKEKNYQEAIQAYQKKIASLSSGSEPAEEEETDEDLVDLLGRVEALTQTIEEKEAEIEQLKQQLTSAGRTSETGREEEDTAVYPVSGAREKLLILKSEALELKSFYLDKIAGTEQE
jgi:outer membrane protein assembly factor BamD (BamD/ComL family)